jgi:hypothetical protein
MSPRTRRRVFLSVLVVALTLPVETLFLQTLAKTSVQQWADGLSSDQVAADVSGIEQFPFAYRRALMARLPATAQARVWQNHINAYIQANPSLPGASVTALRNVAGMLTGDLLSNPTDAQRSALQAAGALVQTLLGRDVAWDLMYQLGPPDGAATTAAVPLTMRLKEYLNDKLTLLARDSDCECAMNFGCYDMNSHCSQELSCNVTSWGCGWFWLYTCNGLCMAGSL